MSQTLAAALWHHVHNRLVMLAEGATSTYNGAGSHQKPGSKQPPAVDRELIKLERRWDGCKTAEDQRKVVLDGVEILKSYRPKALAERRDTKDWREAIANDPRPSRVVAEMYDVSHWTVCEYRKKWATDQEQAA